MEEGESVFTFLGGDSSESDVEDVDSDGSDSEEALNTTTTTTTTTSNNTTKLPVKMEVEEKDYMIPEEIRSVEIGAIGSTAEDDSRISSSSEKKLKKYTALERQLVLCKGDESVLRGEYASVLTKNKALFELLSMDSDKHKSIEGLSVLISKRLNEENVSQVLIAGIASLHAFIQSNWTGPKLDANMNEIRPVTTTFKATDSDTQSAVHISQSSLSTSSSKATSSSEVASSSKAMSVPSLAKRIQDAFKFTRDDVMSALTHNNFSKPYRLLEHAECLLLSRVLFRALVLDDRLYSARWWSARAVITHQLMLKDSEDSFSMWKHAANLLAVTLKNLPTWWSKNHEELTQVSCAILLEGARLHLIASHLTLARRCLSLAQKHLGIHIELTGIEGVRTKFQKRAIAQLVLLLSRDKNNNSEEKTRTTTTTSLNIRNVRIEDLDEDTHLLEHANLNNAPETATGRLSVIEQQLLLLRAEILGKSRAMESTLIEQMRAHVERVFVQPESYTIQITALLMRSRLEIAKSRTRERALLQLQTIVDDLRGNVVVVDDSKKKEQQKYASTHQRFRNFHGTPLRPLWEIRKELAGYYLGTGMVKTASSIFEDLELWDEAVSCMIVMGQKKKAVKRVRDMIETKSSPELLCLMGALTKEDSYFHKAWKMSDEKYGRAMRQLARLEFERDDYENAAKHMSLGLAQSPLRVEDWFLLGSMYLQMKRYKEALAPFQRVVAQQSEDANAWANLAATHARLGGFEQAYSAMKIAVKHKQSDVKMWNNLIVFCVCSISHLLTHSLTHSFNHTHTYTHTHTHTCYTDTSRHIKCDDRCDSGHA